MGEIFFQLEQYPWATFYFYQARALMPRNQIVSDNLQDSLAKLNLESKPTDSIFRQIFFFHTYFSLPERLQILSFFTGLLFVVASLFLWKRYRFLKGVIAASFFVWFLFFCSVLYTKYFEPLEGVVVKSSMLYRNANRDAATVMKAVFLEGSKEEILDVVKGGEWLKIRTANNKIGFIPSDLCPAASIDFKAKPCWYVNLWSHFFSKMIGTNIFFLIGWTPSDLEEDVMATQESTLMSFEGSGFSGRHPFE